MSMLSRLFGRRGAAEPAAPHAAGDSGPVPVPIAQAPDQVVYRDAAPPEGSTTEQPSAGGSSAPAAPAADLPLRELGRYRTDPAYKNFMAKAKRPPGSTPRRPHLDSDDLNHRR